ncbi:Dps family protein [Roseateles amylovorans]|uniref:DNA starvation/stationary phase protection protein n=1 Tax=Roseateles amylovorans TaxID=2978473 RepID=A0ABY6AVA3_9BURK|nr:DNA starvation/stationary phase protection protein [Roseateles amylovorans]UXH77126.1 DNA starvation/stationary phase protection protein [Roseateles amylovorans]
MATKKKSSPKTGRVDAAHAATTPTISKSPQGQSQETQRYGDVVKMPHGLSEAVVKKSVASLNQVLADTITLRDMYKKHHWQVVGPTFNQLHLLFDKHFEAQVELVDLLAERIQILGGVALAMAPDIAEETRIPRPPRGREPATVQLSRLIEAHTMILTYAREHAEKASDAGDAGTDDLLVSDVVRTNELQVWFLSEHLVAASPI